MADEFDRKIMPGFLQTTLEVYLGAAYKSFEAMKAPQDSIPKVLGEVRTLFTVPSDARGGLSQQAQAIAANWMEKGATWFEECKSTGQKFTEGK